jgi:hypothetical protein
MTQGYKFKTKFNGKVSVRALCEDCLKESVYETVVAGIYSDTSSISAAELGRLRLPIVRCLRRNLHGCNGGGMKTIVELPNGRDMFNDLKAHRIARDTAALYANAGLVYDIAAFKAVKEIALKEVSK